MRRTFSFATDEYYHIYNRGTDKRTIFIEPHDYNRFIVLLHLCNNKDPIDIDKLLRGGRTFPDLIDLEIKERLVNIGAYCLMPNHFHILVKEINENSISIFMRKLSTAYSMYFNKKYKRSGALFETSFKAKHVNEDRYLKYLFAYINLNPIKLIDSKWKENGIEDKVKAEQYLLNYRYSSYLDFLNKKRKENKILNNETFSQYFQEPKQFVNFVNDWIDYFETNPGEVRPHQD